MTVTHLFNADRALSSHCDQWDAGDDISSIDSEVTCLDCRYHDAAQAAWEVYVSQPSNFGEDTPLVRMAEHDAFFAAYIAAIRSCL